MLTAKLYNFETERARRVKDSAFQSVMKCIEALNTLFDQDLKVNEALRASRYRSEKQAILIEEDTRKNYAKGFEAQFNRLRALKRSPDLLRSIREEYFLGDTL